MTQSNDQNPSADVVQPQGDPTGQTTGASSAGAGAGGEPPATGDKPGAGGDILDTASNSGAQSSAADDVLAGADGDKQEGVPDQYTFEPPEGMSVDQEVLDAAMAVAKDAGLTQVQFQKLTEFDVQRTQAAQQAAVDGWNTRVQGWREAARTDKEFGGEAYDANVKTALSVVDQFGDKDLKALLRSPSEDNPDGLAIGNHPALLRFLNRIGKKLGDPSFVQGDATTQDTTDEVRLRRMYPSMFKESA